jgi:predicted alpha-1,2-mannosidase
MMRSTPRIVLLVLAVTVAAAGAGATKEDARSAGPAAEVDPFIGTGGHGHTYPGATLPFGMVQLSPDTRLTGWDGCSAYHHSDAVVYGFSHTHLSGTGIPDYGDILFMPVTGTPQLVNGYGADPDSGYGSRFDKRSERAGAGWYAVELADYGIGVELTATERTGLQRYRLPAGREAHVIVDLAHRDELLDASLRVVSDHEIEGHRRSTGWADDQLVHFVARFSRPFTEHRLVGGEGSDDAVTGGPGEGIVGRFSFGDGGGELLVQVGISAVDVAGARANLDAEQPGRGFDALREAATRRWDEALGRIEIAGGTREQRTIFYTALYHALVAPNLFSDVDGRYRGMDRQVHRAEGRDHYTVFSLWDTFRSAHPLYTLIEPERTREFIEVFLAMYREGGRLPVWELAGNETDTMIGYHAIPVIADAWLKGIRGFDGEAALEAMLHSATRDHFGLDAYRRQGFIGGDDAGESVSRTLEYAFDDACIARMAGDLGRDDVAAEYHARSQGWRHLLDPETGFMRPRRNQRWLDPFDPRRVDNHYTEANSWQYSFFVPHDVEGLIEALGGDERFVARLDALFEAPDETTGRDQPDITGLVGQYAHGNEPSHHMAWLYHYAGRPDAGNARVREIFDTLYAAAPDGLSGNEDCGQMSAWYVLAAIGIYPVCPCDDLWVLGSPLFDEVRLQLAGGKRFVVRAERESPDHLHVQAATLNGKPLQRAWLRHHEIVGGGELVLRLGPSPGAEWGRAPQSRPFSRGSGERVLAAPFARAEADRFRDTLTVELASAEPGAAIRFTTAAAPGPIETWDGYREPLELDASTRIRFVAEADDGRRSPVVESYFHRIPHDWSVELRHTPNGQYTAGGADGLVDGLRGAEDWRLGGWQGYQESDFEATVDLGQSRPVRLAGASFLQDARSWIWMPREVVISVSADGESYREVATLRGDVADDAQGVHLRDLTADLEGIEARYVRVQAVNHGTIPGWHPGRGQRAFIFVDEILID